MMGRPLPLTPPTDGYCIDSRPHTPLRYQNDSPFVTTSRAGTGSTNHTKRSFTKSPSSQLETQSADDKQRNAEELLKQVPWFQPKLNRSKLARLPLILDIAICHRMLLMCHFFALIYLCCVVSASKGQMVCTSTISVHSS
ncbi:hypothetical protein EB796_005855 [Bugula neritina]|uniref:Uncharacterized protein n=1 Tax=Bugula neritina TaxID=10212 RepID=A0A7J7KC91_BUGNE|nr:hypothetical protein EB796_005855 [Bugula neritina]